MALLFAEPLKNGGKQLRIVDRLGFLKKQKLVKDFPRREGTTEIYLVLSWDWIGRLRSFEFGEVDVHFSDLVLGRKLRDMLLSDCVSVHASAWDKGMVFLGTFWRTGYDLRLVYEMDIIYFILSCKLVC